MFVMNNYLGTLTLSGNTTVNNNTAADGGGVGNYFGPMTLSGNATVNNNTATRGGGIYNVSGTLNNCNAGGNVFGNTPNDIVG